MSTRLHQAPRWFLLGFALAGLSLLASFPTRSEGQPRGNQGRAKADAPPVPGAVPDDWVKAMTWRCIGPANMSGRITAISVFEQDPSTYWVATASGGLLKTTNNGVTFKHQFDKETTISIGDVCVAPSDRNIVWVGTGEANPRNSVSWGDGVYKSTDGGETWTNMGLKRTFQIGKIIVHPKDPNIVYVGALGRLYGPSPERGLFKTTDGGKTWDQVFYTDDKTGVIDMVMHPQDPDTLLVAMWERQRDGHDSWPGGGIPDGYDSYDPVKKWGVNAGIYKTTDGGKKFRRITAGLPTGQLGRIGLDWYRKDPNILYAVVDGEKIGMGTPPKTTASLPFAGVQGDDAGEGKGAVITEVVENGPAARAGLKAGDVINRFGDRVVKAFADLTRAIDAQKPDDKVKVKYVRDKEEKEVELTLGRQPAVPGTGSLAFMGEDVGDNKGVRITQVIEGGAAARAGLKPGDVVRKVGNREVGDYQALLEIARGTRAGEQIKVEIIRDNETQVVDLTVGRRTGGPGGGGFGGPGGGTATRPYMAYYGGQRENVQGTQGPNGFEYGGVYKSADGGESWTRVNSANPRPMYFSVIRVDPSDDNNVYLMGISMLRSADGGKSFRPGARGIHADQHAFWINPKDGRHLVVGTDGGHYVSYDRGANWDHLNTMALGQFYHVAVSTKKPYWVFGGLQDNGSWGGPSVGLKGGIGPINEDWVSLGTGDGYRCAADPNDPDLVYWESQNGGMGRVNLRTGERASIRPPTRPGAPRHRFNWNTPFILSQHNSRIFYCAGEYVFRSLDRGNDLRIISPELTRTKHGSGTALAESPRNPEVLWAGTDDGNLWLTRDGGKNWTNVAEKVGLLGPRWVTSVEASRFAEGRAYVAFDGHRSDDDEPYVYQTDDFGQTWKSLRGNLPAGSTRVLREDVENPNLLYVGTEFAIFASVDRGGSWTRLNNNLPTVAVHEIAVHPTAGEIVAATHGRSLWILDVAALRQMSAEKFADKPTLYKPNTTVRWQMQPSHGRTNRRFVGTNPPPEAQIYYSLPQKAEKVSLRVLDIDGQTVATLSGRTGPGLHRVAWDLSRAASRQGTTGGPRGGTGGGAQLRTAAPAGSYRVVLTVDGQELAQSFRVEGDPNAPPRTPAEEEEEVTAGRRID